ncbi:MAG: carbohydrate-binding family 9-like protein [Clostridia bacterium]|nr:carbohydrate-binding family 9-like protein [Clostridia bacterium]
MKRYTIARVDGRPDWDAVPTLSIDEQLWRPPVDIAAWGQVAWDDGHLYVRLRAREKDIRAEHTGPLGMPCEDSCLEFFFSPVPGDPRYFNIEYNPNGSLYLGWGDGRDAIRLLPEREWLNPVTSRTEDGWTVEYAVPFGLVRMFAPDFRPVPGMAIRANCYKCGDLTAAEHYLAWNPCTSEAPNFHRPQDFGEMTFG